MLVRPKNMKVVMLNDATTHYMYDATPCIGVVNNKITTRQAVL